MINPRWIVILLGIILNIINYFISPQRYSSKKCISNIKCNKLFYYIILAIFILDILFVIYLSKTIGPPLQFLPNFWWIGLIIIFGLYIVTLYQNTKYINDNCNEIKNYETCNSKHECAYNESCYSRFILKPKTIIKKNYRVILCYLVLFVYALSFGKEYNTNTTKPVINNFVNNFIKNRFGGSENTFTFIFGWSRILSIILIIINLKITSSYFPCKYNLPTNWK